MQTKRWYVKENPKAITEAAELIKAGSLVAFPTETVYGLGADATNQQAVHKIFQAKNRPQDNPLIVHVPTKEDLKDLTTEIPAYTERLIDLFTPGPITFVLPSNGKCANNVTKGLATIAVRIPQHPVALEFLRQCKVPVAAPSANLSGKPSPTSAEHVWGDLQGKIAGILDDGSATLGMESTVIDCTGKTPIILRPGGITYEQIKKVVHDVSTLRHVNEGGVVHSPGMKYKHYAPDVPLWLVEGSPATLQEVIDTQSASSHVSVLVTHETMREITADQIIPLGNNLEEIASRLYDLLRSFKVGETDLIICEGLPKIGIGRAVMNRLEKAAVKHIH